jgi:EpsI family protein
MLKNVGIAPRSRTAPQSNPSPPLYKKHKPQVKEGFKASFQPQFIAAIVLLVPTLVLSQGIEFREKIPISRSLDQLPLQVGEWTGTRQGMEQRFVDSLDLSDYVIIDYRNSTGKSINLCVAYYESQRKGESIHSPATCLPGSGWLFREAEAITLSTPGQHRGSVKVNRAYMEKLGSKQLCYYWFSQRGRILSNAYQLKIFAFWDDLTKQRTDGALVRLITPVSESEELKEADARLQGFVRLIVPVLAEYIPGEEIGGLEN